MDQQPKKPMSAEKTMKLQVFAVLSVHKDLVPIFEKKDDRIMLGLSAAYDYPAAHFALTEQVRMVGQNPDDFKFGIMQVSSPYDKLVDLDSLPPKLPEYKPGQILLPAEKKTKSVEEMCSHILYVFNEAGTPEQIKVAEDVVAKFKQNVGSK